ncbi:MAG: ATP-binding protein, partial [Syntrophales bacterium]
AEEVTVDTPVPFRLKELWFRQHYHEYRMVTKKQGGSDEDVVDALVLGTDGKAEQPGDAEKLILPKFRTYKSTGPKEQHVSSANEGANLRQQMALLHSRLRDQQLQFLFSPGDWAPDSKGVTKEDLDTLLASWMCKKGQIAVLDLSGIPSSVLDHLIGAVLRILFDAAFWGRLLPVGGRMRPLLIVLEEAHRYLGKSDKESIAAMRGGAAAAARRIAKEGRKYGVGLMLVSQRPSEVDTTILSQCGTMISLRLTNEADRNQIAAISSDNLKGLFSMLPILRTHEALIVGEAVNIPIRARIDLPPSGRWPDSEDPMVVVPKGSDGKRKRPGGWTVLDNDENYKPLVEAWRKQDAHEGAAIQATNLGKKKSGKE